MNTQALIEKRNALSIRAMRGTVGILVTIPLVAGFGLNPWIAFGLAVLGIFLVFSSLINETPAEGIAAGFATIALTGTMLAKVGPLSEPLAIATISALSIAIVATILLGFKLPAKRTVGIQRDRAEVYEANLKARFGNAANDHRVVAA